MRSVKTDFIVGILAPLWLPVPPPAYGGIEDVILSLVLGLRRLGVKVVLFSVKETARNLTIRQLGIKVGYCLEKVQFDEIGDPERKAELEIIHATEGWQWLAKQHADVVLDHTGSFVSLGVAASSEIALVSSIGRQGIPIIFTLHGAILDSEVSFFRERIRDLPGLNFVSISDSQGGDFDSRGTDLARRRIGTIHNGIRVGEFPFSARKRTPGYLLSIGRITPDKGQLGAIQVARELGKILVIAGSPGPTIEGAEYWNILRGMIDVDLTIYDDRWAQLQKVKKMLYTHNGGVIYVGPVNFKEKCLLYRDASCFLMPILWPEPFGLVMAEALACGTPVVAFGNGAASEVVIDGETGFVIKRGDIAGMVAAVRNIGQISRRACRQRVEDYFSHGVMAEKYLEACQAVLAR